MNNALDLLFEKGLLFYAQSVSLSNTTVSWHALHRTPFLADADGTIRQYLGWLASGHFSALLPDGSLLQLTYMVEGGDIVAHRLAYVPCPVALDPALVSTGEPVADLVALALLEDVSDRVLLRSSVRFDYDPSNAKAGHPAAHLTLNDAECRIACVAPLHPHRFLDFVFANFYPVMRSACPEFFEGASQQIVAERVLTAAERAAIHVAWPV